MDQTDRLWERQIVEQPFKKSVTDAQKFKKFQ